MRLFRSDGPMAPVLRFCDWLALATEWIAAALLGAIIAVNTASVIARYAFSAPIGWSEEFMRYAIVWAVYIVAGASFRRGEQMVIDLIDLVPSKGFRLAASVVSLVATLTLAAVVVVLGLPFLLDTGQVSPSMRIPMWIPYASVVVGYAMIALQAIATFVQPPPSRIEEVTTP